MEYIDRHTNDVYVVYGKPVLNWRRYLNLVTGQSSRFYKDSRYNNSSIILAEAT